jgi:hypothetical protein
MRTNLFFGFLFLASILSAQTFTEMLQSPPLQEVYSSSVAFADIDGDNDQDVLITGLDMSGARIAKLYTNNGAGIFAEVTGTPFEGAGESAIAFADVDGDNDLDVLIAGRDNSASQMTKLYRNDGYGVFSEATGTPFEGVFTGSIAFADVDGDNDQDVLITGLSNSGAQIAKLYTNNGSGAFSEVMNTPFEGVFTGSIAFADVDGDDDPDVLITGLSFPASAISKLYINDGYGVFSEATGTPFEGVQLSSIAFADVDGDDDPDVLITGLNSSFAVSAKLYINNGDGIFSGSTGTDFEGVQLGSIAFADVDGDNDPDVLITGENNLGRISQLYINEGGDLFSETTTALEGVGFSSIAFADVDGDDDQDVLITGINNSDATISKLYRNDGGASSMEDLLLKFNLDFAPYPNPATANRLSISYDSPENGFLMVKVYTLNGILIYQQKEYVVTGQQAFSINIASLSPGSYFLELERDNRKGVARFMIQ